MELIIDTPRKNLSNEINNVIFIEKQFEIYFLNKLDILIKNNINVDYEYELEINKQYNSKIINKYTSISKIIFPILNKIIKDHKSYFEIESIQLFNNEEYNNDKEPYNNKGKILLNEKNFSIIRTKILYLFLLEIIDKTHKNYYDFEYIENVELFNNIYNKLKINLGEFISYTKLDEDNYIFDIEITLKNYIMLVCNSEILEQFNFFVLFLFPFLKIKIKNFNYEYFTYNNNFIKNEENNLLNKIIYIFIDYILYIQNFLNLKNIKNNIENIYLNFINSEIWVENLIDNFQNIKNKNFIDLIVILKMNLIKEQNNDFIKEKLNEILYIKFNHFIFNLYGKYSGLKINKKFFDNFKFNSIQSFVINFYNFEHYDYFQTLQEKNYNNMLKIFNINIEYINKIITVLNRKNLKLISFNIKQFNSKISYINDVMLQLTEFIKDLISKNLSQNLYLNFSNVLCENDYNNIFYNQTYYNKSNKYFNNNYYNNNDNINDLILSTPNLFFDINIYNEKIKKIKKNKNSFFYLTLFENNIKIVNNKNIEFYFFNEKNYFNLNRISHLKIGYFNNLVEINVLFNKFKLYELYSLQKIIIFIKNNSSLTPKILSKFFSLKWPKNNLKSIKIIFEKNILDKNKNLDMNLFSNEIINKYYFFTESFDDLNKNKLLKYQSDLTVLNKNSHKFENINQINSNNNNQKKNIFNFLHINNINSLNKDENLKPLPIKKKKKSLVGESTFISSNNLLINNKTKDLDISILNNKNNLNALNSNSNNYFNDIIKYPLNFVLFCSIDNYIQYKINNYNLFKIYNNINFNEKFDKNNEKKFLRENFIKNIFIKETKNYNNETLLYVIKKLDYKYNTNLFNKLCSKVKYNNKKNINLFQYIFLFMKNRLVYYNDFYDSEKVFKKYKDLLGKNFIL